MKKKQLDDSRLKNISRLLDINKAKELCLVVNDILRFMNKICIPKDDELKHIVLSKGYKSKLN